MTAKVKSLATTQVQLPNGLPLAPGAVAQLDDKDYAKINPAVFGVALSDLSSELAPKPIGLGNLWVIHTPLITLANVTASTIYSFQPTYAGSIVAVNFVVRTAVTTAAKLATLTWKNGTTATTGGAISLTSAAATPAFKYIQGSQITGTNTFAAGDTLNLVASSVTAFVEGDGYVSTLLQLV